MSSTSEIGHAKNVANFQDLIAYCTGYGATYDPPKPQLEIPALNTLLTTAQTEIAAVASAKNTFDTITGNRQITFQNLKPLATRIINFLPVTDASEQTIADAKTINNKIQGRRTTTILPPKNPDNGQPSTDNHASVSRQSYDSLTENFAALIDLVTSISSYTPNETDLQVDALNTTLADMQTANTNVIDAEVAYSNARISRDNILYAENTGLVEIAADIKNYVKAVFGSTSAQYKQISGIKFTNRHD